MVLSPRSRLYPATEQFCSRRNKITRKLMIRNSGRSPGLALRHNLSDSYIPQIDEKLLMEQTSVG